MEKGSLFQNSCLQHPLQKPSTEAPADPSPLLGRCLEVEADCPRASAHWRSQQLAVESHSCLCTRGDEHNGRWSLRTTGRPPARNRRESWHTLERGELRGHHPSKPSSHGRTKSTCFRGSAGCRGVREQGGRSWNWEEAWGPSTGTERPWGGRGESCRAARTHSVPPTPEDGEDGARCALFTTVLTPSLSAQSWSPYHPRLF